MHASEFSGKDRDGFSGGPEEQMRNLRLTAFGV